MTKILLKVTLNTITKLEQFFKREDKNMKLQGLSITDWISDNRV
jgi:hypothetical protein